MDVLWHTAAAQWDQWPKMHLHHRQLLHHYDEAYGVWQQRSQGTLASHFLPPILHYKIFLSLRRCPYFKLFLLRSGEVGGKEIALGRNRTPASLPSCAVKSGLTGFFYVCTLCKDSLLQCENWLQMRFLFFHQHTPFQHNVCTCGKSLTCYLPPQGKLSLQNKCNGNESVFILRGVGDHSLPVDHVVLHCTVGRTTHTQLNVPNYSQKKITVKVQTHMEIIATSVG